MGKDVNFGRVVRLKSFGRTHPSVKRSLVGFFFHTVQRNEVSESFFDPPHMQLPEVCGGKTTRREDREWFLMLH